MPGPFQPPRLIQVGIASLQGHVQCSGKGCERPENVSEVDPMAEEPWGPFEEMNEHRFYGGAPLRAPLG